MMKLAVILSVLFVQALAMTTKHHRPHHTGPTHEPQEHESFAFKYDINTMMLAARVGHKCYLYTLSGDETTAVHTAHGLHSLEMKMITAIDDTTMTYTSMTLADLTTASKVLGHLCVHANHVFKLN